MAEICQKIIIEKNGGPEVMVLVEDAIPTPKAGEILVRLSAIGVNFIDIYHRIGLYPLQTPTGLGLEGAGVVIGLGDGVAGFAIGDRVGFCQGPAGAYSTHHCVPASKTIKLPDFLSDSECAAILLKGMTAAFLIEKLRPLGTGNTVLFHAAAGGVGLIACPWLKAKGVRVIGTAGGHEKVALAAKGCDEVVDYRAQDFRQKVLELTDGNGCAVVFDSVGKTTLGDSILCAARRGLVVSFGNASGPPDPINPLLLAQRGSLTFTRPTLFDYARNEEELAELSALLFQQVKLGNVSAHIGQTFPLVDAAKAHIALENRQTTGSTLLTI